jgi:CheY-like chemotaxis protein
MVNPYSDGEGGSTVRVYLPVAAPGEGRAPRPEDPEEEAEGTPARARGDETILLVEDDPALRRAAQNTLEGAGYRVLVARDGQEGLEIFRQKGGGIDLVLTDLIMPRMGGQRLFQAVRREGGGTRFLFASGYDMAPVPEGEGPEARIPFLPKPWTGRELTRTVREILDGPTPT